MSQNNVFRGGKIHVMRDMCKTCIYRPGNRMHLAAGRREDMEAQALRNEACIVCHSTLGTDENAVCKGFASRHQTMPLRMAAVMGCIQEQAAPASDPEGEGA